jgi:hypothetical protein
VKSGVTKLVCRGPAELEEEEGSNKPLVPSQCIRSHIKTPSPNANSLSLPRVAMEKQMAAVAMETQMAAMAEAAQENAKGN